MYFEPWHWEKSEEKTALHSSAVTAGLTGYAADVIDGLCREYGRESGAVCTITAENDVSLPQDGYKIVIADLND